MTQTTPNLTKLNFDEIKSSLTDFLKNQTVFSGFNFEGTVIQTVIDLLAYNTYYYAFYSNMIANEAFLDTARRPTSIISLLKPLGYTVPGKKSASSIITIYTPDPALQSEDIPRYRQFIVSTSDGNYFTFYNINPVSLIQGYGVDITVVEAKQIVIEQDITSQIDLSKQKFLINDSDVDLSTIRIEVKPQNETYWEEWTNVNFFPNNDSNIFFIDRLDDTFVIDFGKDNNLGRSIKSTDQVRISYLITSGSAANDLFNWTDPVFQIYDALTTSGGSDGPDLNLIRFLAPKVFSAQERAVTSSDYAALLLKSGYITNLNEIAIYGGDEIIPPKYGRVFISFSGGIGNPREIIEFLREKNMITVIPEYIIPQTLDVTLNVETVFPGTLSERTKQYWRTKILESFKQEYSTYSNKYSFNLEFDWEDWTNSILKKFPIVQNLEHTNTTYEFTLEDKPLNRLDLYNTVSPSADAKDQIISTQFESITGQQIRLSWDGLNLIAVNEDGNPIVGLPVGQISQNRIVEINKIFKEHLDVRIKLKSVIPDIKKIKTVLSKLTLNLT